MVRVRSEGFGFFKTVKEAERALGILSKRKIRGEIREVTNLLHIREQGCEPHCTPKKSWTIFMSKNDIQRAKKILDENQP
jgi:hypothetical protein